MKKISVVGLGYVGLPLAISAARAGYDVVGVDSNPEVVKNLNSGLSPIKDVSDSEVLEQISLKKFEIGDHIFPFDDLALNRSLANRHAKSIEGMRIAVVI
jgi:UDP-N-acetyl-D-mannosaminuronate dehydrogenase